VKRNGIPLLAAACFGLAVISGNAQQNSDGGARFVLISKQHAAASAQFVAQASGEKYQNWLREDVRWIIDDDERKAFQRLSSDEERDLFIESFWRKRNPFPGSERNVFKEEHYRRILYANEHFASLKPGWKTDRGRFYIWYGPPDRIEEYADRGTYRERYDGPTISNLPLQIWHYRYIKGVGSDVTLPFADICHCGDYRMTRDNSEDAKPVYRRPDEPAPPEVVPKLAEPPPGVRFKDLEQMLVHKLDFRLVPFAVKTDFVRVTNFTVMVPISVRVENRGVTFAKKRDAEGGKINIFGRVTSPAGRVVEVFEDSVEINTGRQQATLYQHMVPLRPGQYWLGIVVQDVNGDRVGTSRQSLEVPEFEDGEPTP